MQELNKIILYNFIDYDIEHKTNISLLFSLSLLSSDNNFKREALQALGEITKEWELKLYG